MPDQKARQVAVEAKYLRPRLGRTSVRADAREAFSLAFQRRLAVVCAPAGYGKTTATAACLEQCGCRASWYKLDALDHDPLVFLTAVTRALRRLQPEFGSTLLQELESSPTQDVPPSVLAARFCSECDRVISTPSHLVLDDYHEAMDAEAMNEALGYLLENCPDTLRFVVLTRYQPAFALEKLRLRGDLSIISRDLLLFDEQQVDDIVFQRSGCRHPREFIRRLLALTEGWPASVVLAGMALSWRNDNALGDALGSPRLRMDIFSYLAEQVFQRQPDEVREFLLRTCCLEHVSVQLGEHLTRPGWAARRLHYLGRHHIFTFATRRRGTYRYHKLMRDFLRQRFVQERGERAFRALQLQSAEALEACGERAAAVDLLLGANELDDALEAIARGGETELERRPSEQLRDWVEKLSAADRGARPWTLIVSGVLDVRESRFPSALSALSRATRQFEQADDRRALYEALSITEWAEFWSGDSAASMATCRRTLELAGGDHERLHTLLGLFSAALDMRQWDVVSETAMKVDALLPRARPEEAARAQALRAHAAFYRGSMRTARSLIHGCPEQRQAVAQKAATLNTQGMICMALAAYSTAARCLDEAARIAKNYGGALLACIEDNAAFLSASTGHATTALRQLDGLRSVGPQTDPTMLCSTLMHCATIMRRAGDLHGSVSRAGDALEKVSPHRDPYLAYNTQAGLAFAEGLLGYERRPALHRLSSVAARAGLPFVEHKALLFAGILAHTHGESTEAVTLLECCLPAQLELGHINLIAQELCPRPELVVRVTRRYRENGLGPPLIEALSHHWNFDETAKMLRQLGPSQIATWLDHLDRGPSSTELEQRPGTPRPRTTEPSPADAATFGDLTSREREVLELMARDRSNQQIAAELFIALSTVKTHVNHILRKTGQTTRVGAVLAYQRMAQADRECDAPWISNASPPQHAAANPPWV